MHHFINNNLFSKRQFGFITGRSTVLQLLNILDTWTASLDVGGRIDTIYTDFEKAFGKVPHIRLLSKLKSYGISEDIIQWIKDFLCHRQQKVRINGKYSKWHRVLSGIPQGSVLGPLLFVIYINDLVQVCEEHANIFLFADDAKIFKDIKSEVDHEALQQAVNAMCAWSDRWLLSLNASKCVLLTLGNEKPGIDCSYKVTVSGVVTNLSRVSSTRDLGVTMDSRLNFKEHIYSKVNKAFTMIGIIKRNFKHMDCHTFLALLGSIIDIVYIVTSSRAVVAQVPVGPWGGAI
jgi:hypothetical protein